MSDYRYTDEADPQALRAEVARLRQDVQAALGQLRHAYTHAINRTIGDPNEYGRHLLGPAIARIETALAQPACPARTEGACATCAAESQP